MNDLTIKKYSTIMQLGGKTMNYLINNVSLNNWWNVWKI